MGAALRIPIAASCKLDLRSWIEASHGCAARGWARSSHRGCGCASCRLARPRSLGSTRASGALLRGRRRCHRVRHASLSTRRTSAMSGAPIPNNAVLLNVGSDEKSHRVRAKSSQPPSCFCWLSPASLRTTRKMGDGESRLLRMEAHSEPAPHPSWLRLPGSPHR